MRVLAIILALMPFCVSAQDWTRLLTDEAVTDAIANRTVVYDEYTMQTFSGSGATQYITERAADGWWAARAGQYCSIWPPSGTWACYDVYLNGDRIRFVAADRSVSEGVFRQ